jgi:hypothetical protein
MSDDSMMSRIDAATIADLREQVSGLREARATHAEKLDALDTRLIVVSDDVKKILGYVERTKGSWKTLIAVGGITTAAIEGVHQFVSWIHHA